MKLWHHEDVMPVGVNVGSSYVIEVGYVESGL